MIADFYEAFGQDTDANKEIPAEVLALLNNDLPDSFVYVRNSAGEYMAVPRPDKIADGFRLTTDFDFDEVKDAELLNRLQALPRAKWPEYLYRLQRTIPVKNVRIGNETKTIPIERTIGNPLQDKKARFTEANMYPQRFPEPITITFESVEGDSVPIKIQQQAHDSFAEVKFQNIDFPALKIEIYYYAPLIDDVSQEEPHTAPDTHLYLTYSVKPAQAATVKDALAALRIFKGLFDGTVKMNGTVPMSKGGESTLSPEQIDDAIKFWAVLLELENKLKVRFVPSAKFPMEDVKFLEELRFCLIEKQALVWKHPFDHFHMGGYRPVGKGLQFEDLIGKENLSYQFTEGPIAATLLGAEFNIYSRTEIKDFVITDIDWDNESKAGGDVYIADAPGKELTLSRLYITEEENATKGQNKKSVSK